ARPRESKPSGRDPRSRDAHGASLSNSRATTGSRGDALDPTRNLTSVAAAPSREASTTTSRCPKRQITLSAINLREIRRAPPSNDRHSQTHPAAPRKWANVEKIRLLAGARQGL